MNTKNSSSKVNPDVTVKPKVSKVTVKARSISGGNLIEYAVKLTCDPINSNDDIAKPLVISYPNYSSLPISQTVNPQSSSGGNVTTIQYGWVPSLFVENSLNGVSKVDLSFNGDSSGNKDVDLDVIII